MTKQAISDPPEFSLVFGGPLFRFFRRVHLAGESRELTRRRVLVIALVAWLPLLLLSLFSGHALGGPIKLPFLYDIEAQLRFLVALPILVAAELIVHSRLRTAVKTFVDRGIIVSEDMPRFHAAINSAMRVRESVTLEIVLLVMVYTLGLWIWRSQISLGAATWYATPEGSQLNLTPAGYWYAFVSIPMFQFILLRWYFRFFIWFQLLWRVSKLNLRLIATHPDQAGGLGFLAQSSYAFGPILFAQGTMLAGLIASRVLYEGQNLMAFKMEAAGFVLFFVVAILSPLLVFATHLARAKREGLRDYGRLGSRYVQVFQEKWIREGAPKEEELLGTGDIQSLADLGNSFAVVREMRLVPFGLKDVSRLAVTAAAPLLPLTLTIISLQELVTRLIKILL